MQISELTLQRSSEVGKSICTVLGLYENSRELPITAVSIIVNEAVSNLDPNANTNEYIPSFRIWPLCQLAGLR